MFPMDPSDRMMPKRSTPDPRLANLPRPGAPKKHAAATARKVTLVGSIAAALGLVVAIGSEALPSTSAGASSPTTVPPRPMPSATSPEPTTTTGRVNRRSPSTVPTAAPQATTTTAPEGPVWTPPQTRTRGSGG